MTDSGRDANPFFRVQHRSGCLIFLITSQINPSNQDAFKRTFEDAIASENPGAILIVPERKGSLTSSFLRSVAPTSIYFRDHNLHTYIVTDDASEIEFLKSSGLSTTFSIAPSIEAVLSPQAPHIDVNFVNPFVDGALAALSKLAELSAKAGKSYIKSENAPAPGKAEIATVIGLTSKHFRGSVALCFNGDTLFEVARRILDSETKMTTINTDVETALSQLMGHLFYTAAIKLGDSGLSFERAVPTIVKGRALEIQHLAPTPTLILPFTSDVGMFWMEITVTQ